MFFPNSPKGAKRRQNAPIDAFWRHVGAFLHAMWRHVGIFRHEVAFLRLLTPFSAFLRTFALLGQYK